MFKILLIKISKYLETDPNCLWPNESNLSSTETYSPLVSFKASEAQINTCPFSLKTLSTSSKNFFLSNGISGRYIRSGPRL